MGSLNKVMLIGRLGKDPEIRYTQSGSAVANFSIATSDTWTDKQGQRQEKTEWHDVVAWNKLADLAQNYLKRGSQIYLEGRLQTRSWDDNQTGQKRYKTEINASTLQFLDSRPSDQQGGYNQPQAQQAPPQAAYAQQSSVAPPPMDANPAQPPVNDPGAPLGNPAYIEDDVPF